MNKEVESGSGDTSFIGLVLRILWMAGPMCLPIFVGHIVVNMGGAYTFVDGVYFAVVAVIILARYLDVAVFGGSTTDGARATMTHFLRYAGVAAVGSVVLWGGGRLLAPFVG